MRSQILEHGKNMGRRERKTGVFLAALALFFGLAGPLSAASPPALPDVFFSFDVDVLWFPNSARARLSFRRIAPRRYRAELMAETKGVLRLISLFQKTRFTSDMEFDPATDRLLPLRSIKTITRTSITVDRQRGKLHWRIEVNQALVEKGMAPIPKGVIYEDLLTAFFNFREGAYGRVKRGQKISIRLLPLFEPTPIHVDEGEFLFPEKKNEKERMIEVQVVPDKLERRYRRKYRKTGEEGFLVIVKVPKDLFGQETGEIRVWFDSALIPTEATVEDAIFFGDVTGRLRRAFIGGPLKKDNPVN